DLDWEGVRYPLLSFRAINDEDFLRGRDNPEEGGAKTSHPLWRHSSPATLHGLTWIFCLAFSLRHRARRLRLRRPSTNTRSCRVTRTNRRRQVFTKQSARRGCTALE